MRDSGLISTVRGKPYTYGKSDLAGPAVEAPTEVTTFQFV